MENLECDVVIVGAGLSGLSAAYYLRRKDKNLRILILEAKDRIGGRTLTRQLSAADGSKDFWDIGGEWLGRPQPHINYLLSKFQMNEFKPVAPTSGKETSKIHQLSWSVYLDLWQFRWKLLRLQKKMKSGVSGPWLDYWDSLTLEAFKAENLWTLDAQAVVDSACHCMFGITASEMTVSYFLMNVDTAGGLNTLVRPETFSGGEFRVKGGMQQLSNHLANEVDKTRLHLGQPVTRIAQSIEGARVTTLQGVHVLCQQVVMAVPPHHAASIDYTPALPSAKLDRLKNIPLAFLIKFTITYDHAFWRRGKNRQPRGFQAVLTDPHMGPIGLVYEATSGRGNPALSGFISHADKIDADPTNRRCLIQCLIEQHLGPQCQTPLEFCQMDWSLEPYNGGCFLKNFIPEIFKHSNNELREPFDRIHFAGTESATVWCGFMNGAVQSGFRAGAEVLYQLRPELSASPYPDTEQEVEDASKTNSSVKSSMGWLGYLALGAGVAALIYFYNKNHNLSEPSGHTFVKNIRLVLDPLRS